MPAQARVRNVVYSTRRGLTLVELLIVIAFVALVAIVVMPTFARASSRANASSCQSNLRHLALGIGMYSQEYDETLPPVNTCGPEQLATGQPSGNHACGPREDQPYHLWTHLVFPYVRMVDAYNCPDSRFQWKGEYTGSASYGFNWAGARYARDRDAGGDCTGNCGVNLSGARLSHVKDPSGTLMLVESNFYLAGPGPGDTFPSSYVRDAGGADRRRHGDMVNCVYADGRVRAVRYEEIISPGSYQPWTTTADR